MLNGTQSGVASVWMHNQIRLDCRLSEWNRARRLRSKHRGSSSDWIGAERDDEEKCAHVQRSQPHRSVVGLCGEERASRFGVQTSPDLSVSGI